VTDVGLVGSPSVHLHKVDTVVDEMMQEGTAKEALAAIPAACTPPPPPLTLSPNPLFKTPPEEQVQAIIGLLFLPAWHTNYWVSRIMNGTIIPTVRFADGTPDGDGMSCFLVLEERA